MAVEYVKRSSDGAAGLKIVMNRAELEAIALNDRKIGLIVSVEDARTPDQKLAGVVAYTAAFKLSGGLTNANWKEYGATANEFGDPVFGGKRVLRTGDAPTVNAADLSNMVVGQVNLFTVQKSDTGEPIYGAGIEQVDKLAAASMAAKLADNQPWIGQQIILMGVNTSSELGENGQEFYHKRRWYLCISSTPDSATWQRNSTVSMLDTADAHDSAIIAELLDEAGWITNAKTTNTKSVKGDEYCTNTGYYYTCYSDDNKWRRVGEPKTADLFIQNTGNFGALVTALTAHDFAVSTYDAIVLAAPNERGQQGQKYYHTATRAMYECIKSDAVNVIWEKVR